MTKDSFSFSQRLASFKHAFDGFKVLWKYEHNARIHFIAGLMAISLALFLSISWIEWAIIILCIAAVLICELFNSCIENTLDFISTEHNIQIKNIKDLSSAAVLLCAIAAATVGSIIFAPKCYFIIQSLL